MKFSLFSLCFLLFLTLSTDLFAQQPTDTDNVVKITTDLVQLDALVTDKDGNPVSDLKADEFEIFQDGKAQKITSFSYVRPQPPTGGGQTRNEKNEKVDKNTPPPPLNVTAGTAGRILTFIIDDGNCSASSLGILAARQGVEKFVIEQMQPNDLVALYQTRSGSSMLQQYTSDKTKLLQVVKKIRWYPPTGVCSTTDGSFYEKSVNNTINEITGNGIKSTSIESDRDKKRRQAIDDFARNNQTIGTIGVINYVVRGLERVPGRKLVFLLSDGLPIRDTNDAVAFSLSFMRDLTDTANRASVVFNTIDVRGLSAPMIEARDSVSVTGPIDTARPSGTSRVIADREKFGRNLQEGLFFLANETGGRFFEGANYLDSSIGKALSLERGYYLIGYEPDENTFKGKDFNKIEMRVKRPNLKVISRTGFLGKPDVERVQKPKTAESELYQAIAAPLPRAGLNLRLTAFFGNTPADGNFVRSLITLNGREIAFADDGKGGKKAVFDVVAVTMNEKNQVVDEFNKTHTITVDANTAKSINENGLVYSADVPIKKDGTYNLRVAVRDGTSRLLGSAGQTITVPNLQKENVFLSGLSLSEVDQSGKFVSPALVKPENGFASLTSKGVPAVRQFKTGTILAYSYVVYNADLDQASKQPNISTQIKLYRDGAVISEGAMEKLKIEGQSDLMRINDFGYLRLNEAVPAGDYALQVIVRDGQTNRTVSQWIDFEVVN